MGWNVCHKSPIFVVACSTLKVLFSAKQQSIVICALQCKRFTVQGVFFLFLPCLLVLVSWYVLLTCATTFSGLCLLSPLVHSGLMSTLGEQVGSCVLLPLMLVWKRCGAVPCWPNDNLALLLPPSEIECTWGKLMKKHSMIWKTCRVEEGSC